MPSQDHVKDAMQTLLKIFEDGNLEKVARAVSNFRFEDTEGAPIISEGLRLEIPFEFNTIIQELGLKVDAVRYSGMAYGSYNLNNKAIKLASPEIDIFLHELAHAVDHKLNGLKPGQHKDQEVTAEFSGAVIGHLMGYKVPLGNVKEYICLLYTSDAADDLLCVDLGGR